MTAQSAAPSPLATPPAWDLVSSGYVDVVVPMLERFARDALRVAAVAPGARLLDVACGPGTLSLLAARTAARVDALDFAPAMIAALRERATAAGISNVEPVVGDGQALPYGDAVFAGAFSMFGLMFFPDRGRGFAELRPVLAPGGRVVVSSWQPLDRVPTFALMFAALREAMPGLPFGAGKAPLGEAADFHAELTAAGFRDVQVDDVRHRFDYPSFDVYWRDTARSTAPLVLLRKNLGEPGWAELEQRVVPRLRAELGSGPQSIETPAWLGSGTV